jgi:uncharacterized protein (TIGR02246 family)
MPLARTARIVALTLVSALAWHPLAARAQGTGDAPPAAGAETTAEAPANAPADLAAADAAVRDLVLRLEAGWNSGDAEAFAGPFTDDADYVAINGAHLKGREAIARGHRGIFETIYKGSRNQATIAAVRFLRPDVAVVHARWRLEYLQGGGVAAVEAYTSMVAVVDTDGEWRIAAFQNTRLPSY